MDRKDASSQGLPEKTRTKAPPTKLQINDTSMEGKTADRRKLGIRKVYVSGGDEAIAAEEHESEIIKPAQMDNAQP